MTTQLNFYYDFMSPPSRAVYILLKLANVSFKDHQIALREGAQQTPEFKAINRFQKVPCIVENGFKLSESVAILQYLQAKGVIPENLYPKEIYAKARNDEYLAWHHSNTHMICEKYMQLKWVLPIRRGKNTDSKRLALVEEQMGNIFDILENTWLANTRFLVGNTVSVADIFCACEIEQIKLTGYDSNKGRPKLKTWLEAVRNGTTPYYSEAHKMVDELSEQVQSKL